LRKRLTIGFIVSPQPSGRLVADDSRGLQLTNRDYNLARRSDSSAEKVRFANGSVKLRMNPAPGVRITETWRLSQSGNLVITRVVMADFRKERQRLVLVPTTSILE
jgi:hypothetical protein